MPRTVLNLFEADPADSTDRTVCKFILIRLGEEVHLVFGPQHRYPYHASLVEEFCRRYEIASGWEHRPDVYAIYDGTADILGGGYFDIAPAARRLAAYGSSTAYGGFTPADFRQALDSESPFAGFEITVQ